MKDKSFGARLKHLRNRLKLKQRDAAKYIGVSYSALQGHEGGGWPNQNNLQKYLDFYRCDKDWLLTGKGELYINDKGGDIPTGPGQVSGPAVQYDAVDPFGQAVTQLREIYDSTDLAIITALQWNLKIFIRTLHREQQVKQQDQKITHLEKECEDLKARVAALEEKLQEGIVIKKEAVA